MNVFPLTDKYFSDPAQFQLLVSRAKCHRTYTWHWAYLLDPALFKKFGQFSVEEQGTNFRTRVTAYFQTDSAAKIEEMIAGLETLPDLFSGGPGKPGFGPLTPVTGRSGYSGASPRPAEIQSPQSAEVTRTRSTTSDDGKQGFPQTDSSTANRSVTLSQPPTRTSRGPMRCKDNSAEEAEISSIFDDMVKDSGGWIDWAIQQKRIEPCPIVGEHFDLLRQLAALKALMIGDILEKTSLQQGLGLSTLKKLFNRDDKARNLAVLKGFLVEREISKIFDDMVEDCDGWIGWAIAEKEKKPCPVVGDHLTLLKQLAALKGLRNGGTPKREVFDYHLGLSALGKLLHRSSHAENLAILKEFFTLRKPS